MKIRKGLNGPVTVQVPPLAPGYVIRAVGLETRRFSDIAIHMGIPVWGPESYALAQIALGMLHLIPLRLTRVCRM